ncbi:hypothetical protein BXZ70DRAFT_909148 [Cristinia sonorae]|uniref:Peptidase M20 dimerisation domain-containing protein n=1 Tax=Cristinia sonorae TaxID=1940300 RepID=A0A8K0UIQ6_9AGAR|nr:hypothetical protein BXZ70DRAFT_909148 [Cristinia sonorae]
MILRVPLLAAVVAAVVASPAQQPLSLAQHACPQHHPLTPTGRNAPLSAHIQDIYDSPDFQAKTIQALSGAVKVPSESYDAMGPVGEDPRYAVFADLHAFFRKSFPLIHSQLNVSTVNTYNLVIHWQGSDPSLLPILMTGHQDVVPVDPSTWNQWEHPPYSGHYDGTWIWGRGTCDDKGPVVSILTAVETLLGQAFKPTRSFVFAFGIDEESSGLQGAGKIAKYLQSTYGKNGFAAILDEGSGFTERFGEDTIFVVPSTSEKGYMDVKVDVSTLGGHSSVPPPHTSIGILSALIVTIEANPHKPTLLRTGTPFATIQCTAAHAPGIPQPLRDLAHAALTDDDALEKLGKQIGLVDPAYKAMVETTQAVDLIVGGVKTNALPEGASAVVNHRIGEHSSVHGLQDHITKLLAPLASQFNLTFDAFGTSVSSSSPSSGHLTVSDAFGTALEPAPPTPLDAEPWKILVGTAKASLSESKRESVVGKKVFVSPMLALGNTVRTDTKSYWNLTKHIFRYTHMGDSDGYNGAHTVNEAIRADALIDNVRFLTKFILNWDEAEF